MFDAVVVSHLVIAIAITRLINSELYHNLLYHYLVPPIVEFIRRMYFSFGGQNDLRFIVHSRGSEDVPALLNAKPHTYLFHYEKYD